MRKSLLTGVALGALTLAGAAIAADLPRKAPVYAPPPPPPVYSWTGCYAGANVGWGFGKNDVHQQTTASSLGSVVGNVNATTGVDTSGAVFGGQVGCDYQFAGGWVVGIQGDYDWANADVTTTDALSTATTDNTKIRSLASVTARVGQTFGGRFLAYVKGGGAWERDDYWATTIVLGTAYRAGVTRSGWTVGIGGEYAFTNWLSGFAEYDYYDFGTRQNTFSRVSNGSLFSYTDIKETKNVFKIGLNLRWGAGPLAWH